MLQRGKLERDPVPPFLLRPGLWVFWLLVLGEKVADLLHDKELVDGRKSLGNCFLLPELSGRRRNRPRHWELMSLISLIGSAGLLDVHDVSVPR